MSSDKPWPPSPDLESILGLVSTADVEGLIEIHGAPGNEYEPEGKQIFSSIQHLPTANLTVANLMPILESVWRRNFIANDSELALRRPALEALAQQIERRFGPNAQPQPRSG
jgi:hypothetical protein